MSKITRVQRAREWVESNDRGDDVAERAYLAGWDAALYVSPEQVRMAVRRLKQLENEWPCTIPAESFLERAIRDIFHDLKET